MTLSFAPERIEQWSLEPLKPYARNAKTHGANKVAKIAGSMAQFGRTVPCMVAEDGELIAGHGRVLAAEQLGLTEAPVIVLGHLTEEQRRAYRLADNKLTELCAYDEALLAAELQELAAHDFDLSLVGFSDAELDQLLAFDVGGGEAADAPGAPPVVIPEPPRNPSEPSLLTMKDIATRAELRPTIASKNVGRPGCPMVCELRWLTIALRGRVGCDAFAGAKAITMPQAAAAQRLCQRGAAKLSHPANSEGTHVRHQHPRGCALEAARSGP